MPIRTVRAFGVNERDQTYQLLTDDGSFIHFSNDGVDGSGFDGWPAYSFDDYHQSVTYAWGSVNFQAVQGNHVVTIPLGQISLSDQLRTWLHAVNARLPRP